MMNPEVMCMNISSFNPSLNQKRIGYDKQLRGNNKLPHSVNFCALDAMIFDADGTMVNSSKCHVWAWRKLILRHPPKHIFRLINHFSKLGSTKEIVSNIYLGASPQKISKYSAEKENLFLKEAKNLKEIKGFASFINSINNIKIGVATCASPENLAFYLRKLKLQDKFNKEFIVDSSKVTKFKPDPEVYLKAVKALGVSPDNCVAFEDSAEGVTAAVKAGLKVVGVASSLSKEALVKLGASLAIKDYTEINLAKIKTLCSH